MWTKLMWLEFPKALRPIKNGQRHQAHQISRRYQAKLKKEFRIANVPWIFEKHVPFWENNPRNRKPKGSKRQRDRPNRIAKIEKNLELAEQAELDYRLNRLNNKKLTGIDLMIQRAIPSFLSMKAGKPGQEQTGAGLVKLDKGKSAFSTKKK